MKEVLFCSYRDWADQIIQDLKKNFSSQVNLTTCSKNEDFLKNIEDKEFDLIFFIGWSDIIESEIVDNNFCICLHPSLLPKYRGGSPIQNQIINGETTSGITLFKMDKNIDTGPIIYQEEFNIEDIDCAKEIIIIGAEST